ncbi:hypothetical protein GH733_013245, partial [Mirounga leonina]
MATIQQPVGRWRLVESKGFDEYVKEVGVRMALRKKFEETTADGRKTQTVCNFTDGALVQHQEWNGKESTITRKLENGKLVVECVINNVTCTQVYEK